jgi:hypothetical protein
LFKYIAESVKLHDIFFEHYRNVACILEHGTFQKITKLIQKAKSKPRVLCV